MAKIIISGGFHNSGDIQLSPSITDEGIALSMGQVRRLQKHMCGIRTCTCSSGLLGWKIAGVTKDQLMDAITNAEAEAWATK